MKEARVIDGQGFREMFSAATDWLEKSAAEINALNVFPVPDGDCGTNMLMTMRSGIEEASQIPDKHVCSVAEAISRGTFMGARGNSGVILSRIWRGVAKGLNDNETIDGKDLARALMQASEKAYEGISEPVEGTILTVMKEAAIAAQNRITGGISDAVLVLETAVNAAREAVADTPRLLAVLRDAGVVDAGGQGLYTLLEGALLYLKGEFKHMQSQKSQIVVSTLPAVPSSPMVRVKEVPYGYCTEFLIKGNRLDPEKVRRSLKSKGQSLIVVGDDSTVRVHIHAVDPSTVIHYALSLGTLHNVSIRNMDEQNQGFIALQKEKKMPEVAVAVVAVVAGEGLSEVFGKLGAMAIVPGGQTMNPSTRDILQGIEAVPSDNVIILPNNKNIMPAAQQAQSLTRKRISVIPTETIPQGLAALLAFDPAADLPANAALMTQAKSKVKTIEITRATRSTKSNGLAIRENQPIGLLDGELLGAGDEEITVIGDLLAKSGAAKSEIITIFYGDGINEAESEKVRAFVCQLCPALQVEVINGGQPNYSYLISVE